MALGMPPLTIEGTRERFWVVRLAGSLACAFLHGSPVTLLQLPFTGPRWCDVPLQVLPTQRASPAPTTLPPQLESLQPFLHLVLEGSLRLQAALPLRGPGPETEVRTLGDLCLLAGFWLQLGGKRLLQGSNVCSPGTGSLGPSAGPVPASGALIQQWPARGGWESAILMPHALVASGVGCCSPLGWGCSWKAPSNFHQYKKLLPSHRVGAPHSHVHGLGLPVGPREGVAHPLGAYL